MPSFRTLLMFAAAAATLVAATPLPLASTPSSDVAQPASDALNNATSNAPAVADAADALTPADATDALTPADAAYAVTPADATDGSLDDLGDGCYYDKIWGDFYCWNSYTGRLEPLVADGPAPVADDPSLVNVKLGPLNVKV
ncbi:hypothetical protein E4T56_gene615 [Termitomyces sp. T112]|nr:hypothetical protein E4T56_gene615 [Termitomyces sp. T112]